MAAQSIRPSQFITTFGPGSILEGPDGPRVIYDLARSNVFHGQPVSDFSINDSGLSRVISNETGVSAQIVRLPTNADHNTPDGEDIYETEMFPKWSLCTDHNFLYRRRPAVDDKHTGCPQCAKHHSSYSAHVRSRREAIRFVQACKAGHMDDVAWSRLIRHATARCHPQYLKWHGGGSSLRDVELECPDCSARVNLGEAYSRALVCTSCYPERGDLAANNANNGTCHLTARMLQRGATFLYSPEHISAVTIPNLDTALHQFMASTTNLRALQAMNRFSRGQFDAGQVRETLNPPEDNDPRASVILSQFCDEFVLKTAKEVLAHRFPDTLADLQINEFTQLQQAATNGHPSQPPSTRGTPSLFEVVHSDVRTDLTWPGINSAHKFRVAPVSRLRVVMALLGYRRLDDTPEPNRSSLVSAQYRNGADIWYPGVELFGEGIFIDLAPSGSGISCGAHPKMDNDHARAWHDAFKTNNYEVKLHPVFVWWHTLAHRLIVALAVDSGYSSASIRERVYTRHNDDGTATGGILLYTVQPGGDGTLGGLTALVPRFERVLQAALERVGSCSNDPLCGEEKFNIERANGAICYACGLVSETSCEHRNTRLDRNLLAENPLI